MTSIDQRPLKPAPRAGRRRGSIPEDLLRSLSEGLLILDPHGRVLQSNPVACGLLGAGRDDDLVGYDAVALFDRAIGPDGRALNHGENPVRAHLSSRQPIAHKVVGVVQPDGDVLWLDVRVSPIRERASAAASPLVDAVAVTVSRSDPVDTAIAALRDRDHQLTVAQRMARLSMWRWNTDTGSIEWLDGAGRGMGITGESKGLADYLEGIHPDDREGHDTMLQSLLAGTAATAEVDIRYRWADGWRHWHMWAESVVDQRGEVTALWGTTQEVTERREAEAAVRRLSMTDSLTELANRAQVLERIATALVDCPRELEVGLVLLDVDKFTHVNDRFGPSVGDLLLIEIGRRLARFAGVHRTPGRLGADQFALVLERSSAGATKDVAEHAFADLSRPYRLAGVNEPVTVTVSVGSTLSVRSLPHSTSELLRQSELATAAAQTTGGGRVVVFDQVLRSQELGRLEMEVRLRSALVDGSVFPHYQPIITLGADAQFDRLTSCEALARMDGRGVMIAPSEFVSVAEESGLIVELDLSIFSTAVSEVLAHPPAPGFGLAVNVSPLSLQVPGLVARIESVLASAGVDGRSLRVEITESCLAEPTPTLLGNLRGLRALGAKIGLDDFGTGYSALSYLSRFDLDFMKIDRSFVADVSLDGRARAVVRAFIDLAHAHDLTVVAEGIEDAAQLEALRELRCDMVQGYHLGRPMPLASLTQLATPTPFTHPFPALASLSAPIEA